MEGMSKITVSNNYCTRFSEEHNFCYAKFHLLTSMFGIKCSVQRELKQREDRRISAQLKKKRNKKGKENPSKEYIAGEF